MIEKINIRNTIIIILCSTVILMGIAFIVMSTKLKSYQDSKHSFNVVFNEVTKVSSAKGSSKEPVATVDIDSSQKIVNMSFSLFATHDELTYSIKIKNKGNIPAKIVKVYGSPDYNNEKYKAQISPITITADYISGKVIKPEETLDYKLVVYYNPALGKVVPKNFNYSLVLVTESA